MVWCNSCDGAASWEIRNAITVAQHRRLYSCSNCLGELVSAHTDNAVLPLTPTLDLQRSARTVPPYQTLAIAV